MNDESKTDAKRLQVLFRRMLLSDLRFSGVVGEYEFQLFKWYLKNTDELIRSMTDDEVAYVREQTEMGDPEPNDSGLVAAEYFMRRVRYSHVIYLVSLFESMLKGECERLAAAIGEGNLHFKLNELKGESWVVKRRFLERYGRFEIPEGMWRPAQDLLNLRNVIIHDNGVVGSPPSDLVRAVAKLSGIRTSSGDIEISGEYAHRAALEVETLSTFVAGKVNDVIEGALRFQGGR